MPRRPHAVFAIVAFAACAAPPAAPTAAPTAARPDKELDHALTEQVLPAVVARLHSDDAAQVAWGGYLVQRQRLHDAVPEVRAALAKWRNDPTEAGEHARLALLDVFVQLDVDLPDDEV